MSTITTLVQTELTLGMAALTDCAPLVMAKKPGFFEQQGLDVNLHIQHSWATLRDRLHAGLLDAAQVLAPMPLASTMGLNGTKCDVICALNLSINGNAITLSNDLCKQISALNEGKMPRLPLDANWISRIIEQRAQSNQSKLRFAAVYPFSSHYYQLIDWLNSVGIQANKDVEINIIPPANMTQALKNGDIDGYCVGNPWNAKAVRAGLGSTVVTSCDIWPNSVEKVLAVTKQWQLANPNTFQALVSALKQSCEWLVSYANRFEAAIVLQDYLKEPLEVITPSLIGSCLTGLGKDPREIKSYNGFHSELGFYPSMAQGQSLIKHMKQIGQIPNTQANFEDILAKVYPLNGTK